jgi:uncharacterized cupin superfamily protein
MSTSIVSLAPPLKQDESRPAADRVLAGDPVHLVANVFSDTTGQFHAGRWSSTRGKWRVHYTENELCVLTAGQVIIESETGHRASFGAGDAFVIPAGFSGTWEVVEDCSKIYAVLESRS